MRRVRILGYLYQEKGFDSDSPFYFMDETKGNMNRYFPLPDDASVYALSHLEQVKSIYSFVDAMEELDPRISYLYRKIHKALNRVSTICPFGAPTAEQRKACSFFIRDSEHSCPHIEHGPLYLFPSPVPKGDFDDTDMYWCIVHPEESERMERILNGTDNPLYDLVHELRYNPNISSKIGSERQEAQQDFEQAKKRKV